MDQPILAQKIITEAENILAGNDSERMTEQEFTETLKAIAGGVQKGSLVWQETEDGEQDLVTVH